MAMEPNKVEFGGTFGALILIFVMPFTTIYLNQACTKASCSLLKIPALPALDEMINSKGILIYVGWILFQVMLHLLPWGKLHSGLKIKNGSRLNYRCNGFWCFVTTICAFIIALKLGLPISHVYSNFIPILMASVIFSFILSFLLYIRSLTISRDGLAEGVNGTFIYDFFLGRELNPRIGQFDFKFFIELRPGLIGWAVLDLCFIYEAYVQHGVASHALLLVTFFHVLYVVDALWHEEAVLSTMDITHDGLGFMLVFGNLSWVPFLYSLQARFLLEHQNVEWSSFGLGILFLLNGIGYVIFRLSNSQKNKFRKNPNDPSLSKLKTLKTSSGKNLLVSSWWGISRHPNYLGDLLMSFTWSFVTGFHHIIPYFYPIYFLSLLVHRGQRDDKHCQVKYGKDWDKYCKLVPYKICPYIY